MAYSTYCFSSNNNRANICACLSWSCETQLGLILLMLYLDLISLGINTLHVHWIITSRLYSTTDRIVLCLLNLNLPSTIWILNDMLSELFSILQVRNLCLGLTSTLSNSLYGSNYLIFLLLGVLLLIAWLICCKRLLLLHSSPFLIYFKFKHSIVWYGTRAIGASTQALVLIQRCFSNRLVG